MSKMLERRERALKEICMNLYVDSYTYVCLHVEGYIYIHKCRPHTNKCRHIKAYNYSYICTQSY